MQLKEYDITDYSNKQLNKDYIELFKLYKRFPELSTVIQWKTLNPIGYIPFW